MRNKRVVEILTRMRIALSLAAGLLLAGLQIGPSAAAPLVVPADVAAGSAAEPARMVAKHRYRRGGRRMMGLSVPGSRRGPNRSRLRRL